MDKQVIFKSALNGFEKTAVLKYIDELNSKLAAKENELQQQSDNWENERYELKDQVSAAEQKAAELEKQLAEEQAKLKEIEAARDVLTAEVKKLSQQVEEQEHELILQREQNRLIRSQAETVELKSKKYDEAAASIGDVLLESRQEGSRIIAEARAKAEEIIAEANSKAEQIAVEADGKVDAAQQKMDELRAHFLAIREQMNDSVSQLNDQFALVEATMAPAEEEIPEAEEPAEETAPCEEAKAEHKEHPLKSILEQAAASAQKAQLNERAKQLQDLGQKVKDSVKESMNKIEIL